MQKPVESFLGGQVFKTEFLGKWHLFDQCACYELTMTWNILLVLEDKELSAAQNVVA